MGARREVRMVDEKAEDPQAEAWATLTREQRQLMLGAAKYYSQHGDLGHVSKTYLDQARTVLSEAER